MMNDLFIYLLKVSGGLGIIFLPYYFIFRNDPNLVIKRFYLVIGLIAAWIFPLITFRRPDMFLNLTPIVFIDPNSSEVLPFSISSTGSDPGITLNWVKLLLYTYLTGLIFLTLKNVFIVLKWNLTWRKTKNDEGIAFTRSNQVFTIFSKIFIPRKLKNKQDLDNVLLHEKAHVQQLHFIDLTIMELTLLLTWFNPFSWLISRMIKENHEHLADRKVLSTGINPARYRAQLLNHTLGVNVFRLGSQFNHSLTLKRFNMMKKPKKSPMGIIKIALLIPAILVTLGLTIGMTPSDKVIKGKVVIAETGESVPGASIVIKGTTVGTVTDMEGLFMLKVDGDPEIVISFVGYANISIKASKIKNKPLKLEQKAYVVDLDSTPNVAIRSQDGSEKNPVYVLDGKVVKDIESLDSESIEKIEVIKDPDSEIVKKYNAQDGVVVITSKDKVILSPKESKKLIDSSNQPKHVGDEVFYIVENMPMFPGGKAELKKYIYSNLKYPETEKNNGVIGEVHVQFVVSTSGKIEDTKVVRSTNKVFDKPSLEVFKDMPDWNPGSQRGKPVKVQVVVPIRFTADTE